MKVRLNNTELTLNDDQNNLVSLMKDKNLFYDTGIAVAINEEIIPRQSWTNYSIKDKDNILIITATQGG